jgi:enoyl-CoA hydratase/carnithine racemase
LSYGTVIAERIGTTVLLRLNRPEKLNAYVPEMGQDLVAEFRRASADPTIRAVIVTGNGRAFCAGADRAYLAAHSMGQATAAAPRGPSGLALGEEEFVRDFAPELKSCPKLTIAAFNGAAIGIGVTMALCTDMRIAAAGSKLKLNFAELGILPGFGSTFMLTRLLGPGQAKRLLLCDPELSAERALELGLIEEICAPENLLARAHALADAAGRCPSETVAAIKKALDFAAQADFLDSVRNEQRISRDLNVSSLQVRKDDGSK